MRAALVDALDRGVRMMFIIETREDSGGRVWGDAGAAIGGEILRRAEVYVWPMEERPTSDRGGRGKLHAKCALADDVLMLVSSANLTEPAMSWNMELGVLIEGGEVPGRVGAHLRGLVEAGVLRAIDNRTG